MKRFVLLWVLSVGLCLAAFAQIQVRHVLPKRAYYRAGDTVRAVVTVKLNPQSCLEGMRKTYFYFSDCEEVVRTPWTKLPNAMFRKTVLLRMGSKPGRARMTITRNTDKESFFRQETWVIK